MTPPRSFFRRSADHEFKPIEINVTQSDIDEAIALKKSQGDFALNKSGHFHAQVSGNLGELIFQRWLSENWFATKNIGSSKKTDLELYGWAGDKATIEVKVRNRTVPPLPNYQCGTYAYHVDYEVSDFYAFLSSFYEKGADYPTKMYIVGLCSLAQYKAWGRFVKKGELEPDTNFRYLDDSYTLPHYCLTNPEASIRLLTEKKLNCL